MYKYLSRDGRDFMVMNKFQPACLGRIQIRATRIKNILTNSKAIAPTELISFFDISYINDFITTL